MQDYGSVLVGALQRSTVASLPPDCELFLNPKQGAFPPEISVPAKFVNEREKGMKAYIYDGCGP